MDGGKIDPSNKLIVVSGSPASLYLYPYSSNDYHLTTAKLASLPGNQYFLPGYTSKSFVSIDLDIESQNFLSKRYQITSFAIAPRVDFFLDFFNAINLKFDQRPTNVIVTTDTAGKIRILVNAHEL